MKWYYALGKKQAGPVDDAEFQRLRREGTITPNTLVWHQGMPDWRPVRQVPEAPSDSSTSDGKSADPAGAAPSGAGVCSQCGRLFAADQLLVYEDRRICAACKPFFFQGLKEGVPTSNNEWVYGGFWIRWVAKLIDHIILSIAGAVVNIVLTAIMHVGVRGHGNAEMLGKVLMALVYICGFGLALGYHVWFVGRFGATPGKMACGLRIITANGGPVTCTRALGRFFAEMLSSCFTLNIGYLIAAFDDEKRTLHDRLCDTRVIRKGA